MDPARCRSCDLSMRPGPLDAALNAERSAHQPADAAACHTEKVHAGLGHVTQRLNHPDTRFAEGCNSRRLAVRASGSIAIARPFANHCGPSPSRLSCSSPSIMVYAPRRVEPDHRSRSLSRPAAAGALIRRTPSGKSDSIAQMMSTSAGWVDRSEHRSRPERCHGP